MTDSIAVEAFVERWRTAGGGELANAQSYLVELCDLLGVPKPDPKQPDETKNDYVFERGLSAPSTTRSADPRRVDLYKRGCFVLESKQGTTKSSGLANLPLFGGTDSGPIKKGIGFRGTQSWGHAMQLARTQADGYVRVLPKDHVLPPFLVVVGVGYLRLSNTDQQETPDSVSARTARPATATPCWSNT